MKKKFIYVRKVFLKYTDAVNLPEVYALLPDFNLVTTRQDLQVRYESTGLDHLLVAVFIERLTKQNVLLQGGVLNPCLLGHIGQRTLEHTTAVKKAESPDIM